MPEGDTVHRTAEVLRRTLREEAIVAARGRPGAAALERLVGCRTLAVRARGKHLLIEFDDGLTLHTHLGMQGSWHRYRPGERWRLHPSLAVAVLETRSAVAVCFAAPTVELLQTRAVAIHPVLARLGPDLLDEATDVALAARRLLASGKPVAEALLDQAVVAGIGNVVRNELLFGRRQDPFRPASRLSPSDAEALLQAAMRLLRANTAGGERVTMPDPTGAPPGAVPGRRDPRRWVYRRAGRPCRVCGATIRSAATGHPPRRLYWCPVCQAGHAVP